MTKATLTLTSTLVAAAMLTMGCASATITTSADPAVNLAGYRTWDFSSGTNVPSLAAVTVIQVEVGEVLSAKGYERDTEAPDLLLFVHPFTAEAVRNEHFRWGFYDEPGATDWWWDGGGIKRRDITVGSVLVDLVDRADGRLVWRGFAQGVVRDVADVEERLARVKDTVARMLGSFPDRR